jgi:hypothetical protein
MYNTLESEYRSEQKALARLARRGVKVGKQLRGGHVTYINLNFDQVYLTDDVTGTVAHLTVYDALEFARLARQRAKEAKQ